MREPERYLLPALQCVKVKLSVSPGSIAFPLFFITIFPSYSLLSRGLVSVFFFFFCNDRVLSWNRRTTLRDASRANANDLTSRASTALFLRARAGVLCHPGE